MHYDIGIDLGTQTVRAVLRKQGAVLEEASMLAFRDGRDAPVYGGTAARDLIGRTCENMTVERPLKDGVLENNLLAERLFRWLFRNSGILEKRRFNALITCAPFARPVQREALMLAAKTAGADQVSLVRSDCVHALGAGLNLKAPEAKLVMDVGAGKVTATLFTFGRVAAFDYLPYGLERVDERIQQAVRAHAGYRIGLSSAEEIKRTLGSALPSAAPKDVIMHMSGFSIAERLPGRFDVETAPVLRACEDVVREMVTLLSGVVDGAPEELSADLNDAGVMLTGGGALLTGLDKRVGDQLGVPCAIADAPGGCGARGLQTLMDDPDAFEAAFQTERVGDGWRSGV